MEYSFFFYMGANRNRSELPFVEIATVSVLSFPRTAHLGKEDQRRRRVQNWFYREREREKERRGPSPPAKLAGHVDALLPSGEERGGGSLAVVM